MARKPRTESAKASAGADAATNKKAKAETALEINNATFNQPTQTVTETKSKTQPKISKQAPDSTPQQAASQADGVKQTVSQAKLDGSKSQTSWEKMDVIPIDRDAGTPSISGSDEQSKVVYIGHLPHGFYEKQLLAFFSQFGKLTRIRLSRNKKTAKAKHYAFLEFQYPEVAKIAADTMDGYFMFSQKLSVRCLKQQEVHQDLFKGGNRKFKRIPWRKIAMERMNKDRTPAEHAKRVARLIMKDRRRQRKITAAGIDFQYEGLGDRMPVKAKRTVFA